MKTKIGVFVLMISLVCFIACFCYAQRKQSRKPVLKQTLKADAQTGLPDQPRCNQPALPDITIEKFEFSGPGGPWKAGQRYGISVVLKNIGQCDSGVFLVKLQARVQVPSESKDQTTTVGSKKVFSIPPRKTGASTGTSTASFSYATGNYQWAQYTFTATVDHTNHIEEFDEANNEKTSPDQTVDTMRD